MEKRFTRNNGSSWKYDKNKSTLHAKNLFPSIEVYGMTELYLSLQTYIIGVIAKRKEYPLIRKLRDRSYECSHLS